METDDFLIHYGVLGMKWGVRKSSSGGNRKNKLFRKKPSVVTKRKKAKQKKQREKDRSKRNKKMTTKSASKMTDAELAKAIKRLEMEKRYKDLSSEGRAKSKGKEVVKDIMWSTGSRLGKEVLYQVGGRGINAVAKTDLINVNDKKKKKDQS